MTRSQVQIVYRHIVRILWEEWDPIGINEVSVARDEYSSYVAELLRLKINDSNEEDIAQHLSKIEIEQLCLSPNIHNNRRVALLIKSA
jgi:hypothetical protein